MSKKKWVSYLIDGVLIAVIALLGYVQISMMATKSGNHGVPMAFGYSFLYVSTDSMDNADKADDLGQGSGILLQKVDPSSLHPSTPIFNEDGTVKDFQLDGDVVTFYYEPIRSPDTHRLVDMQQDPETGKWSFRTMGDSPKNHEAFQYETWTEDEFIGKVVSHSKGFGTLLTLVSPDAAASVKKTAWLLPVGVIVPLVALATLSIVDVCKTARARRKEEEEEMRQKMIEAGIDLEDEEAVELFKAKEEYKQEYRAKLAEEVEIAKAKMRKAQLKEEGGARR